MNLLEPIAHFLAHVARPLSRQGIQIIQQARFLDETNPARRPGLADPDHVDGPALRQFNKARAT